MSNVIDNLKLQWAFAWAKNELLREREVVTPPDDLAIKKAADMVFFYGGEVGGGMQTFVKPHTALFKD